MFAYLGELSGLSGEGGRVEGRVSECPCPRNTINGLLLLPLGSMMRILRKVFMLKNKYLKSFVNMLAACVFLSTITFVLSLGKGLGFCEVPVYMSVKTIFFVIFILTLKY